MTTSAKLCVVAAFLLTATSVASAQHRPTNPNAPELTGGGNLGLNAYASSSSLQNTRKYPFGPDPLKGGFIYPDVVGAHVANVNSPELTGGGNLGLNAYASSSSLQNTRKYPHGPDPLKAGYVYPDQWWYIHVRSNRGS
jgi:hypothetical protein